MRPSVLKQQQSNIIFVATFCKSAFNMAVLKAKQERSCIALILCTYTNAVNKSNQVILHDYCKNDTGVLSLQVTKQKMSLVNSVTSAYLTHYKNMTAKQHISEYLLQQNIPNHLKGVQKHQICHIAIHHSQERIQEKVMLDVCCFIEASLILPYLLKNCKSIQI